MGVLVYTLTPKVESRFTECNRVPERVKYPKGLYTIATMSFRETVTEEVKDASSGGSDDEQETLEQIEVDFGDTPFVKFYPTTLVSGTFPEDEGNPIIRFPDQSNNDGRRDQGYLGLVLDDLTINTDGDEGMGDATFVETGSDDSTEYRAVNFDDDQTSEIFGGDGVDISGDKYEIEDRVTEIDGRSILVVDRSAAVSVARKLDVNGGTLAGMDESTGQVNGGLIEYAPDDVEADVNRRYARNPELRDELYGEEVGVMVTRRSEVDEDYAERVADPNDDTRDMMWYTVFDMENEEALQPTEGEPTGYTYLEWRFDADAGNLPDSDWEFVQEYIEAGAPTDKETILENIEENSDQLSDDPNTERMVRLIQNDAGQ